MWRPAIEAVDTGDGKLWWLVGYMHPEGTTGAAPIRLHLTQEVAEAFNLEITTRPTSWITPRDRNLRCTVSTTRFALTRTSTSPRCASSSTGRSRRAQPPPSFVRNLRVDAPWSSLRPTMCGSCGVSAVAVLDDYM
uniref:Uncharacterized protein n=1 Tax=Haptolina ericina TaxID=156174 RepID=A0A7S3ERT4_9EUKA